MQQQQRPAESSGMFSLGGDLNVYRLGFGAMRITGSGIWGPPAEEKDGERMLNETAKAREGQGRLPKL